MNELTSKAATKFSSVQRVLCALGIVIFLVGLPILLVAYHAWKTGLRLNDVLSGVASRGAAGLTGLERYRSTELPKGETIEFLEPHPIGQPFTEPPWISHVLAVDLDQDGLLDVVVCDCRQNTVTWIRQSPPKVFTEYVLCESIMAPAHCEAMDIDGDGDLDLLVAVLGMLFPNNDRIGSVIILENTGAPTFKRHIVAERLPRVADVRGGDLNGDGLIDLSVACFGYDDGETLWLENLGNWEFRPHVLQTLSGPIHSPLADMDGDGNLDIVVLVSQEWEQIYVYRNLGKGQFRTHRVFASENEDFGSSGLWIVDLNQDGLPDILYTNGDAFDYIPPRPRPWHGIQWLENRGNFQFDFHRIANVPGAVNAAVTDINGDGYLDIFVASAYNQWEDPAAQSLIWLENDGSMRFRPHDLANRPTHIQALDIGDFDGDGQLDLVTGGLHTYPPLDRMDRVVLWYNRWGQPRSQP
ncbi:MAG: FG-GAP repeat domain-containing protein [Thermogutta sp.]